MRHWQVRDVMTANPMTVTPATPLKDVVGILVRGRIGAVPVLTPQGRMADVVTGPLRRALDDALETVDLRVQGS